MRIRAIGAAVTGALALSAFAIPAAHADEVVGDTAISNIVVNGGKPVVLSATGTKTITVTFTVKDASGVDYAEAILYHGADIDSSDTGALANSSDYHATCTDTSATSANCKATYTLDQGSTVLNKHAGTWNIWAIAAGNDSDYVIKEHAKSFKVQRLSKLTVNAAPEPVKKGKTITVTGKLSRANWDAGTYSGYASQPVKLQFRKKGSSTYTTVKTIKTTSTGALKTTVTASADGYYRYSFAGTSTTPAVNATGDYIDVQ
ncbi:calcium-binding protein [Streptomyces sp. NPDC046909]|uniref:calcium-binding protein n=1 Tax=Streptomyces sp. NPDC046909 TaxID=3155617 RepID=UPI0033EC0692